MNVVLATDRLLLRHFSESDADGLLHMESEPDVLRYVGRRPLADVDAYRHKIRCVFQPYYEKPGGYGAWAIVEKASGEFAGVAGLRPGMDVDVADQIGYGPDDVELFYALRKPSWSRGYATELAKGLISKAFRDMGAARVVSFTRVDNLASIRVLEKVGLRRAGEPLCLPGEGAASVRYALSKDQFWFCQRTGWQSGSTRPSTPASPE